MTHILPTLFPNQTITFDEFFQLFYTYYPQENPEQILKLYRRMDLTKSNKISKHQFIEYFSLPIELSDTIDLIEVSFKIMLQWWIYFITGVGLVNLIETLTPPYLESKNIPQLLTIQKIEIQYLFQFDTNTQNLTFIQFSVYCLSYFYQIIKAHFNDIIQLNNKQLQSLEGEIQKFFIDITKQKQLQSQLHQEIQFCELNPILQKEKGWVWYQGKASKYKPLFLIFDKLSKRFCGYKPKSLELSINVANIKCLSITKDIPIYHQIKNILIQSKKGGTHLKTKSCLVPSLNNSIYQDMGQLEMDEYQNDYVLVLTNRLILLLQVTQGELEKLLAQSNQTFRLQCNILTQKEFFTMKQEELQDSIRNSQQTILCCLIEKNVQFITTRCRFSHHINDYSLQKVRQELKPRHYIPFKFAKLSKNKNHTSQDSFDKENIDSNKSQHDNLYVQTEIALYQWIHLQQDLQERERFVPSLFSSEVLGNGLDYHNIYAEISILRSMIPKIEGNVKAKQVPYRLQTEPPFQEQPQSLSKDFKFLNVIMDHQSQLEISQINEAQLMTQIIVKLFQQQTVQSSLTLQYGNESGHQEPYKSNVRTRQI